MAVFIITCYSGQGKGYSTVCLPRWCDFQYPLRVHSCRAKMSRNTFFQRRRSPKCGKKERICTCSISFGRWLRTSNWISCTYRRERNFKLRLCHMFRMSNRVDSMTKVSTLTQYWAWFCLKNHSLASRNFNLLTLFCYFYY